MSRRVAINLGAFLAVFVLMLWWAVNNIISFDFIEQPYEIQGEFAATAGVASGAEVAYLGVNYGSVSSVENADGTVLITMKIDKGKEIPEGSVARIFRKSAIGEPYIDFNPPADYSDATPAIPEGATIPLDRTQVPLEFSELLRAASAVLGAVEPSQARTLIHELAVALDGRSESLRGLTVSSDALLATFAERRDLLDSLSNTSTRLTRTVTEHRGSLESALGDLRLVAQSLRAVDGDTRVLLDRGTELLSTTADLVEDVSGDLDCIFSDLQDVVLTATTDENIQHLIDTLEIVPEGFAAIARTVDTEPGGTWVRVNLLVETEPPTEQYIPPTELPAVPEVPACASTLRSGVRGQSAGEPVVVSTLPERAGVSPWGAGAFIAVAAIAAMALAGRRPTPDAGDDR